MASATQDVSRVRKIAATAALLATGGLVAKEALNPWRVDWLIVPFAAVLAVASVGITRRSLVAQVLSRGAAWIVLFPSLIFVFFAMLRGTLPPLELAGIALGTSSALLLSRPMLHTSEARKAFAPKAFRRLFLAGSTASAATAFVAGGIALEQVSRHGFTAMAFGILTTSLLASAIAVVRMRGWGIFLGALTSTVLLATAAFMNHGESIALVLAAVPSLCMHLLPVLVARMRSTNVRIADDAVPSSPEAAFPPPYRVTTEADTNEADGDDRELDVHRGERRTASARV